MPGTLSAPLKVEFDYTRSLGPVLSRFMTGLRDRTILGSRAADGRVLVPPTEYDPVSHEAPDRPRRGRPDAARCRPGPGSPPPSPTSRWTEPFAFALVLLDGADTPILHAVDAGSPDAMSTGMRVRVRWADEPQGHIRDILFEPAAERRWRAAQATSDAAVASGDAVTGIVTPVRLAYTYAASQEESRFYRGLAEGKIRGQRCPKCQKVYVPPRGACPVDGVPTTDEVELPDRGIVTTYCIVNVPFLGQRITPPYVSAYVLLEGADIAFLHLILGCDPRRGPDGHAGRGGVAAPRRVGHHDREHRPLPADRRARRAVRVVREPPLGVTRA